MGISIWVYPFLPVIFLQISYKLTRSEYRLLENSIDFKTILNDFNMFSDTLIRVTAFNNLFVYFLYICYIYKIQCREQ